MHSKCLLFVRRDAAAAEALSLQKISEKKGKKNYTKKGNRVECTSRLSAGNWVCVLDGILVPPHTFPPVWRRRKSALVEAPQKVGNLTVPPKKNMSTKLLILSRNISLRLVSHAEQNVVEFLVSRVVMDVPPPPPP